MEKGEKMDCDSMTTVNVKDFGHDTLDYQEPPPAYRNPLKASTTVQVTKIVAVAAVLIAGMLSTALVISAWVTTSSCQQQATLPSFETLLQPEHLRSILAFGNGPTAAASNDLELAESKVENNNSNNSNQDSSEEDNSAENAAITMLKLPLEFSIHEHMFERNHRSHMNCVIEKKKAEEIVDEQSKPLPALLGINMTTDPRYLHFTGEKMAISCDSGNDHRQAPPEAIHQIPMQMMHPSQHSNQILRRNNNPPPQALNDLLSSAIAAAGSASLPIHIIGPIPLSQNDAQQFQSYPQQEQFHHRQPSQRHESFGGPFGALGLPPHLIPVLMPQGNQMDDSSDQSSSAPFYFGSHQGFPQSGEIRERGALPHPIPIMPRAHVQHVIRPRSVDNKEEHKRVKRCACDCACKSHQE